MPSSACRGSPHSPKLLGRTRSAAVHASFRPPGPWGPAGLGVGVRLQRFQALSQCPSFPLTIEFPSENFLPKPVLRWWFVLENGSPRIRLGPRRAPEGRESSSDCQGAIPRDESHPEGRVPSRATSPLGVCPQCLSLRVSRFTVRREPINRKRGKASRSPMHPPSTRERSCSMSLSYASSLSV